MGNRIYVGNLNPTTTIEALRETVTGLGLSVRDIHIVHHRDTGRSRGFGFMEFATAEDSLRAISVLDGRKLDGSPLRVSEARTDRAQAS